MNKCNYSEGVKFTSEIFEKNTKMKIYRYFFGWLNSYE